MKARLASSIRLSYIGVESIFLNSSRLMYLCLASGFVSYSRSSQGFTRRISLSTARYNRRFSQRRQWLVSGKPRSFPWFAFLQVGFVGLAEILRHFFKGNVLFTDRM